MAEGAGGDVSDLDLDAIEARANAEDWDSEDREWLVYKVPALIAEVRRLRELLGRAAIVIEDCDKHIPSMSRLAGAAIMLGSEIIAALATPPAPEDAGLPEGWIWEATGPYADWMARHVADTAHPTRNCVYYSGVDEIDMPRPAPIAVVLAVIARNK